MSGLVEFMVGAARHRAGRLGVPERPTEAELADIDDEWPVIAAEVALVDAECRHAAAPSELTRRAIRRAEHALAHTRATHAHPRTIGA